MEALSRAIKLAGSQQALADRVNHSLLPGDQIGQSAVSEWLRRGRVPGEKVILVARAVEFAVLPHELRPDLYPHAEDGLPGEFRILGLLHGFAEILTPEERTRVGLAIARGPADGIAAIDSLNVTIGDRAQLLKAANLEEGRAA